ncbi:MAG: YchJ family protein [Campylobacterota bacterium]|nr:YchJ family protein [Campylobacterota bacterium]
MKCPCGSGQPFELCCGRFINGSAKAATPLELMRSRYSAYATGAGAYLVETTTCENRYEGDAELIGEFARKSDWIKLEIVDEATEDETGMVEFKAYYRENGEIRLHHEKSLFLKEEGEWRYDQGTLFETKIGRNEACPCGSGKKYKRCCG